jgi:hypothetical protein
MDRFEDVLPRKVAPPGLPTRQSVQLLEQKLVSSDQRPFAVYERDVFNFLLASRIELGIASVHGYRGYLADGAIDLTNGGRILVEIKYRMNWMKACQAEWQFRNCLLTTEGQAAPIMGGLVVFEEFSADWARIGGGRTFAIGWYHWYTGSSQVEGLPLDLVRYQAGGALEWCPLPAAGS